MKPDHLLTTDKNKLTWIKYLNVRPETIKILEKTLSSKISNIAYSNILSEISPHTRERKKKQKGLHQTEKFLCSKGNDQQNKKTTHRMGEHIHQHI